MDLSSSAWIILTGALVAASCALLGCFLVLRKLSMLGDAISHAVLPGIVVAFLLSQSRGSLVMFAGAVVLGVLTTFLVQYFAQRGIEGSAAIGVVFTSLFALGVVLVSVYGQSVDLDLDCVLYGEIAYSPFDTLILGGSFLGPRPVWINGALLVLNLVFIGLFYKELKLCAFDPGMAAAVGINVTAMHYLLMTMVSVTTVGAFESVGAILVVAMFIVPAATAYLLTDRLSRMLAAAAATGIFASAAGYWIARWLDCSIAGAMAVVCGACFAAAFFISPRHGVLTKLGALWNLRRRLAEEDLLLWAWRRMEGHPEPAFALLRQSDRSRIQRPESVARRLAKSGLLRAQDDGYVLTDKGVAHTVDLIRRHRLYESYLHDLGYPADHVHGPADRVEHHLSKELIERLDEEISHPRLDPQGKPIPRESAGPQEGEKS